MIVTDGQTDGGTAVDSKYRAYALRRAVIKRTVQRESIGFTDTGPQDIPLRSICNTLTVSYGSRQRVRLGRSQC